ncbi:MAG: hypothetical protein J1F22_02555 [Lachnospiraceae bacterium]|nr:hypothetical protein [Lachnospiraceae bacterium]
MKEKVLSLAKGNFIFEAPGLILTPEKLEFTVTAGEKRTESFLLENERGTKIKGFGSAWETEMEFLPVFHSEENKLEVTVNAEELVPGEHIRGELVLVTDCGECQLPYDVTVVAPKLSDDKGTVDDYFMLQERIQENPENGARLFHDPNFKEIFLYRDEAGKVLYEHLQKKNTKIHSMEEFLVAMGKKQEIRFEVLDDKKKPVRELYYELNGIDIQGSLQIRVNTWGSTGIRVHATADFIQPEMHILWTDEFMDGGDILEFSILADKVATGRRYGSLILETPYQKLEIPVCAHNQFEKKERRVERAKKAAFLTLYRTYLAYAEERLDKTEFQDMLRKNQSVIERITPYPLPMMGYIQVILREEKAILEFYQQTESVDAPVVGAELWEIENYILIEYIKYLYSRREEQQLRLFSLLEQYSENGYSSVLLFYLKLMLDDRYESVRLREKDIKEQLRAGENSPLLYSELMKIYCEEPALITELDEYTLATINYGLKADLINEEHAVAISFLAERLVPPRQLPLVLSVLKRLYAKFTLEDTLWAICSLLIRNEIRQEKYFPWFEKGVEEHLRLTDLYEYYMYTMDRANTFLLPDSVLSYFQYENHLNETCKAFLYAYIVRRKEEQPGDFHMYGNHIREFALKQLAGHRISEDVGVIYEGLFQEGNIQDFVAQELPFVMFTEQLTCHNDKMEGVLVVHTETKEETYYPFTEGQAKIQIYTPNYQLYFVDGEGNYYTGTVDYTLKKLLNLDKFSIYCYENGAEHPHLLAHLAVEAERGARLTEKQALILQQAVKMDLFRPYTRGKMLLRLYDYYNETKDTAMLLGVLDAISPEEIKRERLGEVATDCIYHGMYDKAEKMLSRYGVRGCGKKALAMLVTEKIQEKKNEFSPMLVKWALYLYRENCFERGLMNYLLQYYMGQTKTLTAIYNKCLEIPQLVIDDGSKERLLGQVVFTGENPEPYEKLFLEYYEKGNNRVLVKAFLSVFAYEFIVGRCTLSEEVFQKIEKEAFYEKEKVMVLSALKYYSQKKEFSKKQKEFIELTLESYASDGLILTFMKDFIGRVAVPYEIENAVLIQYNSGTSKGVFLFVKNEEGQFVSQPMKQVFDGIYTSELLLFAGEEKTCYIYEEETDTRSEEMVVTRPENGGSPAGFFRMVNQMIEAKEAGEDEKYLQLRRDYEEAKYMAGKLFEIL